jgi:hypothetical protein
LTAGAGLLTVTATSGALSTTQDVARLSPSITPTIAGTTKSVPGESVQFTFGAMAGTLPATSKFTYAINWGDGTTQTVTDDSSVVVSHIFTKVTPSTLPAGFPIKVTVTDAAKKTATPPCRSGGRRPPCSPTASVRCLSWAAAG